MYDRRVPARLQAPGTPSSASGRGLREPLAVTWAVLVAATLVSFALGDDHGLGTGDLAALAVLAVAVGKVWLVGMRFMELGTAPRGLRRCFEAWLAVVALGLAIMLAAA